MANYPYYYPQQPMMQPPLYQRPQMEQPQMQFGLKGRPVSSLEEVRATSIDFDGSVFYFPDIANKKIYTKQINLDGTSTLNMYELKPIATQQPVDPPVIMDSYVTKEEFENTIKELKESIPKQTTPNPAMNF